MRTRLPEASYVEIPKVKAKHVIITHPILDYEHNYIDKLVIVVNCCTKLHYNLFIFLN